ncbi:MAG: major facilitator superfamily domain-containing protein [Linnemannia gamsii]|nr:MAG: major facilitator superfamily domain-containing protein [Linnemannia gamsii]
MEATTIATSIKPQLPWYRRLNQNKGLLLALVSMAQMLDIINVASVTITLPDILREVGYSIDQLQWVTSAYALAYGAFLLIGGRFGDLFGHRRIYILGVTWFSIWAVVNGFAKDPVVMSVGRALQGMGAGFTVPSALAILTTTYPVGPERTFALAVFGGTGAVGSVIGVLLGGILGSTIGWRWIFYFTAMLGFVMALLGFVIIPAEKGVSTIEDRRIDVFGVSAFCAGIVCVIFYLSESPASGWTSAKTLAPLIVGLVLLVAFVVIESKIDYPIMPLHIWRSRRLVASCLIIVCVSAAINAMIYFSSLLFQNVLGYSPLKTSLAYIVHGVGAIASIVVITKIVTKVRTKIITIVGWFFFIASGVLLAQVKADSSYWSIPFPSLILNFLGMAPVWLCCQINCVADADDEDQGVVGAVYNVALQIGAPIGIAVANIIANGKNGDLAMGAELLPGYQAAFYSYAVMAGIGLVVTIIFATNSDPAKMHETTAEGVAATAAGAGDEEIGHESIDQITNELKGNYGKNESSIASGATIIFQGSSTSVATGVAQPGEKTELKD